MSGTRAWLVRLRRDRLWLGPPWRGQPWFGPLWRARGGNAAVEFALILPVFLLVLVGAIEFAISMFVGGMLESAVLTSARYGMTGAVSGGVSREQAIRNRITARTLGFVDGNATDIQTYVFPSFSAIVAPEPFIDLNGNHHYDPGEPFSDLNHDGAWTAGGGKAGVGEACEVVLYVVSYQMRSVTGLLQPFISRIRHYASVAVRNEPYADTPC